MNAFVQAARRSGWTIKAFIDESANSAEASAKWRSRRAKEVKTGTRNVPQGSTVLIGEMLKKCGVEVCYSMEADNDDTIAFHAHADNACILSHDKDMFRYDGFNYTVYSDFEIKGGILSLTRHYLHDSDGKGKRASSKRDIGAPPAVQHEVHHVQNGVYLRGAPSPLVRELGFNPHAVVSPLRHAMYSVLGYKGPITEEWPVWNAVLGAVEWVVYSDIFPSDEPDADLLALLHCPDEAVARFFPNEVYSPVFPPRRSIRKDDWQKHVYCVRSVVYELCVMSNRSGPNLLDLWLLFESNSSSKNKSTTMSAPYTARTTIPKKHHNRNNMDQGAPTVTASNPEVVPVSWRQVERGVVSGLPAPPSRMTSSSFTWRSTGQQNRPPPSLPSPSERCTAATDSASVSLLEPLSDAFDRLAVSARAEVHAPTNTADTIVPANGAEIDLNNRVQAKSNPPYQGWY